MGYFINVEGLIDIERQEKWEDARELLYNDWMRDKQNIGKFLRLLSECWYVLSLWDSCIDTETLSYQKFKDSLIECAEFGFLNFNNDGQFLCIAGYMASMLPYLFYNDELGDLYSEWEQRGKDMVNMAHSLYPNDQVATVLNLGAQNSTQEYVKAKESLRCSLNAIFPGQTAVEQYFKEILTSKE